MKKILIGAAALSFVAASSSYGFACAFHSAGHDKEMTTAEAAVEKGKEGMSTFDPEKIKSEEAATTE